MLRLALFDVDETLIHNNATRPHVHEALQTIGHFQIDCGDAFELGIVSDDLPPTPPNTEAKTVALESRFQDILITAGLNDFFSPFEQRVTMSARAGVNLPDRRIFELAIQRSGINAALTECLFVAGNLQHLAACQSMGMTVIRFGEGPGIQPAFSDWLQAPLLIAAIVGTDESSNSVAAVRLVLEKKDGLTGFEGQRSGNTLSGQAHRRIDLDAPQLGAIAGVSIDMAVDVSVRLRLDGSVDQVQAGSPGSEEVSDAVAFVKSLLDNKQVALANEPLGNATHAIELDADGRPRLVRRRYSFRSF